MSAQGSSLSKPLLGMTAIGLVGVVASYFSVGAERFWANWLLWFLFIVTVALGALFIVALEHLMNARWSVPIRRVSERVSVLIYLAVPLSLIALLSLPVLFPWTSEEVLATRPLVAGKAAWLNVPFFIVRVVLSAGAWILSYRVLVTASYRQDQSKDPKITMRSRKFAPLFMVFFAITVTLLGFDWVSSMEPEWFSDIFGVYIFAGSFLAGLAATTLAVLYLRARGRLPGIRYDHLYNLGTLLFAFTVFWSYIGFAQYMLIWYANLPEEVYWYKERIEGPWLNVALLLAVVHFVIPFFALATRDSKGDPRRLRWVATLVLLAHVLDLYWLLFPALDGHGRTFAPLKTPEALPLGWAEASFALFFVGAALLTIQRQMGRGEDMPVGDPFLKEGLEFHL